MKTYYLRDYRPPVGYSRRTRTQSFIGWFPEWVWWGVRFLLGAYIAFVMWAVLGTVIREHWFPHACAVAEVRSVEERERLHYIAFPARASREQVLAGGFSSRR